MNRPMAVMWTIAVCLLAGGSIGAGPTPPPVAPVVTWANFFGTTLTESVHSVAVDANGDVIFAGHTTSTNLPLAGSPSAYGGGSSDTYVAKVSADGSTLLWSRYLGGVDKEGILDVAVESTGHVVLVGRTESSDFPTTTGAYPSFTPGVSPDTSSFIARLDGSNGALLYSSVVGNAGSGLLAVATGPNGTVYATGYGKTGFPTTEGAFDRTSQGGTGSHAVVLVMNLAGGGTSDLLYSTFLGGHLSSAGTDIAVDAAGDAHACGYTYAQKGQFVFPTTSGAFIPALSINGSNSNGPAHCFFKLRPAGAGSADLLYSTFLEPKPGALSVGSPAIALTSGGLAVVAGDISSLAGFTTTANAYDKTHNGAADLFLCVFDSTKSGAASRTYSSFIGGSGTEWISGLALDLTGRILLSGRSDSAAYPTTSGAIQTTLNGPSDLVISILDLTKTGSAQLAYSTRFGGNGFEDHLGGMAATADGGMVVGVSSSSTTGFPSGLSWPYDATANGGSDVVLLKFAP